MGLICVMRFKDFNRGWHRSEKIFQDQGKVREFHFESGKFTSLKKSEKNAISSK